MTDSFRLTRDGDAPLCFEGRLIGAAAEETRDGGFYKGVELFRTAAGKFAARYVCDASFLTRPERKAEYFDTAAGMISWLRIPETGQFEAVAQDAISDAARNDADVFAAYRKNVP